MAIIAAVGSSYTPCPPGVHQGVCVDVIDYGLMTVEYQGRKKQQHKIGVVWQVEAKMDDGRPFTVRKRYTLTLDERGTLRKDLQSWRGLAFTEDELKGFDVEKLIGANCLLNVTHATRDGKTYANVDAIMPLHKGMPKLAPSADYVRVKDRPEDEQPAHQSNGHSGQGNGYGGGDNNPDDPFGPMSDDIPF